MTVDRRRTPVTTLLSEDEFEDVRELAFLERKSMSAWVRGVVLDAARKARKRLQRATDAAA